LRSVTGKKPAWWASHPRQQQPKQHKHQAHNDLPSPGQKEPRHRIYVKIATVQHIVPQHPPHRRKVQTPRLTQTLTLAHNPKLFTNTIYQQLRHSRTTVYTTPKIPIIAVYSSREVKSARPWRLPRAKVNQPGTLQSLPASRAAPSRWEMESQRPDRMGDGRRRGGYRSMPTWVGR